MHLAPIVFFVYKRLDHTIQAIDALRQNTLASESDLFVFSDAPKTPECAEEVQKVRDFIHTINGFKSVKIIEQKTNLGLAKSIISGVTQVINEYGRVIVLEDDLVVSEHFLQFMNNALDFYDKYPRVFTIIGYSLDAERLKLNGKYNHDIYFGYRGSPWGWATWAERWKLAEWEISYFEEAVKNLDNMKQYGSEGTELIEMLKAQVKGSIDSWWIRWNYIHFIHGAVSAQPFYSYVDNIGNDGSGTHKSFMTLFRTDLSKSKSKIDFLLPVRENAIVTEAIGRFWSNIYKWPLSKRIRKKLSSLLHAKR